MPPKKEKVQVQVSSLPTSHSSIKFSVSNSNRGLWNTLRKNEYEDCLQPLLELMDNALASKASIIDVTLEDETNKGSIEDNGIGFGSNIDELSRCFTYAPENPKQTDLNEHGCGMKSSLAILDPEDKHWSITWKASGVIYQVKAPYIRPELFEAVILDTWPGKLNDPTGTILQFPFNKENLGSLYEKKSSSFKMAIPKLSLELGHRWMFHETFSTGKVIIKLNGDKVEPYTMPNKHSEYVSKEVTNNNTLNCGANLHMVQYTIEKNLPNSPWFKKSMSSNGLYLFKNGRLITRINSGREYKHIFGVEPDNHHNGMIVLANITGEHSTLPITVPTKNKFKVSNNPNYEQMINYIKTKIILPTVDNPSEESLLLNFKKVRVNNFKTTGIVHIFETEKDFTCENGHSTPRLDAYEKIGDTKIYLYEAKKENRVSLQYIIQLYGNFILASSAILHLEEGKHTPVPVLLINADTNYKLPDTLVNTINEFANKSKIGFPLEIWNYKAEKLFPDEE